MESVDNKEGMKSSEDRFNQEIYSKVIRAGKRTYFFDVKSTRNDEYYVTITESKRKYADNGKFQYEKHKIFLYREDFEKFIESLEEVVGFIQQKQPDYEAAGEISEAQEVVVEEGPAKDYTDVDFEDI